MTKKLLISVIAIAVIAAVVGTCFALYTVDATNKVVNISADYQAYTLQLQQRQPRACFGQSQPDLRPRRQRHQDR